MTISRTILFAVALMAQWVTVSGQRPSIGIALSGGGAKGLAHIGILKAIDSAGLKVDYITGTSMGSIIGALYATGYSAEHIERLAMKVNWEEMITNQSSLRAIVMEEKEEYSKYAVELPWVNNGFRLPSGVVEGEELWLKFADLFFPVYNIKDFSKFSIPFKCISADIETGEAVVLDSGEIVTAVRSSMAIPSLFTAIENNGQRLIDGGVVRNFPVRDVKAMGADIIIGSRVAMGLQPKEKMTNALKILMQIAFFKEAVGNKEDIGLCDIYIPMPLENYTAGSFSRADEILKFGMDKGRELYPQFKQLADSLNALYGPQTVKAERLPKVDSIFLSAIEVKGLHKTSKEFFEHMMGFEAGHYFTPAKISRMVRKVFGTRYYNRIVYSLQPVAADTARIIFNVEENPTSFAKLGIHYNNFTGISLIGNLTSRNFFLPNSRSLVTLNVGENLRMRAEHLQYLGRGKNVALNMGVQYDRLDINTYSSFKPDGLFGLQIFKADARMQYSTSRVFTVGAGTRFEWLKFKPNISSGVNLRGENSYLSLYGLFAINTLNKNVYPVRGIRIDGEWARIVAHVDSPDVTYRNYHRAVLNAEGYLPVNNRLTLTSLFQGGVNFNYQQNIRNEFIIGGLTKTIRNQILFAGLDENSVNASNVAALQLGFRYEMYNNFYIMGKTNGLIKDFSPLNITDNIDFLSGHSIGFAYNFALGPLEISAMYCDQSKRIRSYINLGIPF